HCVAAGQAFTVWSRSPERARPRLEKGAHGAGSVADACRGDVVVTMLADDEAVDGVVSGPSGALAALPAGAIHVSMSTIGVALSERLAAAHAQARQRFVAAPVLGRPDARGRGRLFIVAAGAPDAVAACAPLFAAMGQRTFTV